MEKKTFLYYFYEILAVVFIPFLVVLFIEFVLRIGMGPFVERLSFFSGIYASIIAVCSYVWIRKKIIFAFLPIILFSIIIAIFFKNEITMISRLLYYFMSLIILSSFSIITYAISKVIRKHNTSYSIYILQFFVGLFIFLCGMSIAHILSSFFNPQVTIVQSLISGVSEGLLIGSGVTIIVIMLSQKRD